MTVSAITEPSEISVQITRKTFQPKWWTGEFLSSFLFASAIAGGALSSLNAPYAASLKVSLAGIFAAFVNFVSFAEVSGAHFNPAISLAFALVGKIPFCIMFLYWIVQLLGFTCGIALVGFLYSYSSPFSTNWGSLVGTVGQLLPLIDGDTFIPAIFVAEAFLTFLFVLVACLMSLGDNADGPLIDVELDEPLNSSSSNCLHNNHSLFGGSTLLSGRTRNARVIANPKGFLAPFIMSTIIGLLILIGKPISGAYFNPALFAAISLLSWNFSYLLLYIGAQIIGVMLALIFYWLAFTSKFYEYTPLNSQRDIQL